MDQNSTPNTQPNSQTPEPLVTPVPTPAPAPQAQPKKILTPEEKKAQRKLMMKRLALVCGAVYAAVLVFIFGWALLSYGKEFSLFNYLPISQNQFSSFFMTIFHVQMGVTVAILFLVALFSLLKSLLTKKENPEKKKNASRIALFSGLAFFLFAVAWLVGIWFLGPRLQLSDLYVSPIKTVPAETIGLTSPIEISFDASRLPVDEDVYKVLSYTWDFGDGTTSNGESTSHTYTQKAKGDGVYTVTLTVRYMDLVSGQQFEDQFTTTVVIANEKTAAYFTATPDSGELPLEVRLDATGSFDPDGEIVAYDWDLDGDGQYDDASGEVVNHTFTQEGDYEVSLRVTDNSGEYNTTSTTIEAGSVNGLRAVISSNVGEENYYYVGEEYSFDGALSQVDDGKITKFTWDFGDGTKTVQTRSVKHTFETAGTYTVLLSVQDAEGNSDLTSLEVEVLDEGTPPEASITTSPSTTNGIVSGVVPLTVGFDASDTFDSEDDVIEYEWDFDNDGTIDITGDTAVYTYEETGTFEARLVVTDSSGNTDESTVSVVVTAQGLVARLEVNQTNGEVPLTVSFDASASSYKDGTIVSYEYDFGDGSDPYIGGSKVSYRYNDVGTFMASVTVVAGDGTRDSESVQIVVRPVALTACFTVNDGSGKAPLFVVVDPSCSLGTVDTYHWDFGDGTISFDRKPETHTYSVAGTYTITLEVTSLEGIVSSFQKVITVE